MKAVYEFLIPPLIPWNMQAPHHEQTTVASRESPTAIVYSSSRVRYASVDEDNNLNHSMKWIS